MQVLHRSKWCHLKFHYLLCPPFTCLNSTDPSRDRQDQTMNTVYSYPVLDEELAEITDLVDDVDQISQQNFY